VAKADIDELCMDLARRWFTVSGFDEETPHPPRPPAPARAIWGIDAGDYGKIHRSGIVDATRVRYTLREYLTCGDAADVRRVTVN
jgi:hypothetical protein